MNKMYVTFLKITIILCLHFPVFSMFATPSNISVILKCCKENIVTVSDEVKQESPSLLLFCDIYGSLA